MLYEEQQIPQHFLSAQLCRHSHPTSPDLRNASGITVSPWCVGSDLLSISHDLFHVIKTLLSHTTFNSCVTGHSITERLHPRQTRGTWGGTSVALGNFNSSAKHP